jgi:hypothetical protein
LTAVWRSLKFFRLTLPNALSRSSYDIACLRPLQVGEQRKGGMTAEKEIGSDDGSPSSERPMPDLHEQIDALAALVLSRTQRRRVSIASRRLLRTLVSNFRCW